MHIYSAATFDNVTEVLTQQAYLHGCCAFSVRDEPVLPDTALDMAGPLTWALIIHANALAMLAGLAAPNELNALPMMVGTNPDAPFGNEAQIQPGRLPMSIALNLLDAALEHAICLGMHEQGFTPDEWDELPDDHKLIPLEPYLADLSQNWITESMDQADHWAQVQNWPQLINRETLKTMQAGPDFTNESGIAKSRILHAQSMSQ